MADQFGFVPEAPEPQPQDNNFDAELAAIRAGHAQELEDPRVAGRLYALTHREVGTQGPEAQQAFMETVFNRAAARGLTLAQTISDPNYYPAQSLKRAALGTDEIDRYQALALNAAQGSNVSKYATGNASGSVGFAGGPQTLRAGGERFGIEGPDKGWIPRARPADVQEVYIEKGQRVTPVEMEVRRAVPIGNPFGFVPEQPAAAAAAPDFGFVPEEAKPKEKQGLWQDVLNYLDLNKAAQPPEERSVGAKILDEAGKKLHSMIPRTPGQWGGFALGLTPATESIKQVIAAPTELPKLWANAKAGLEGKDVPYPEAAHMAVVDEKGQPKTYGEFTQDDWVKFGVDIGTNALMGAFALGGLRGAIAEVPRVPGPEQPEPGLFAYPGKPGGAPEMPPPGAEGAGWQQRGNVWVKVGPAGEAAGTHPAEFEFVPELEAPRAELPAPGVPAAETAPIELVTPTEEPAPVAPAAPAEPLALPEPLTGEAAQWEAMPPETRFQALAHSDPRGARLDPARFTALATSNWAELSPDEQLKTQITLRSLPQDWAPEPAAAAAPEAAVPEAEPEAPTPPAIGDLVAFKMPSVGGTMRAAGRVERELPDGRLEVRLQQGGFHAVKPSEILDVRPSTGAAPRPGVTPEEATAEAEHRAEMMRAGKEEIAAQGGMDLREAVALEGGLPLKGHPHEEGYRGELKMLRETIRGTKGVRYRDVFSGKAQKVDQLTLRLRARGFNIETPHQLIDMLEHSIRTGTPHYAVPEAGTALYGQPGLLKFSVEPISGERYFLPDETRGAFVETGGVAPELRNIEAELRRRHGIQARLAPVRAPAKGVRGRLHPAIGKAEALARANGAKILWFRPLEATRLDTGEAVSPTLIEGGYSPGGRTIALNIDAAKASPVHITAGHEIGHYIKERDPALYKELVKTLAEKAGGVEEKIKPYFAHLLKTSQATGGAGYEPGQLADEMVDNFIGETLRDPGRFAEALGEKPNLAQRILTAIRDWIDRTLRKLGLRKDKTASAVMEDLKGARAAVMEMLARFRGGEPAPPAPGAQLSMKGPLSGMERAALETLRRANERGELTPAMRQKLLRLEGRATTQGELGLANDVFNLTGEQAIDWAARQREAEAAEVARAQAQAFKEKAQLDLFSQPSMPGVIDTATIKENNGAGKAPPRAELSMFAPNTPPGSNPQPLWAQRYTKKFAQWWQEKLPRSYEIVRKIPESPVITEHQRLLDAERDFMEHFTRQPWWQTFRRRTEEEVVDLEHQAVMRYRTLTAANMPREAAWAQAVASVPPDVQAVFQWREGRVPTERWAARQLAVDEPAYTGDPYMPRLTHEEGKAVVDLHPQIANWGRHVRQSIGSFDKSRVHATMKEGIQEGTQYEPPTLAAFVRELYSVRLEGTAKMLQKLRQEGVLFTEKADAIAANRALKKDVGPVTLVRGFGGKDYWARSRVEAQFLQQNLNTTSPSGAMGKMVRVANAFVRNPNLMWNPLPHATKNMAFKYALARIGNYGFKKAVREYGTNAAMRTRFETVMPMPKTGRTLPQLRALEAGTFAERIVAKAGKWLSFNNFSARFNFAKADPALRYALWKTYVKKGLSDQAAANHVWVDLIRYDENSGALSFWKSWPGNFFATWRLGTYVSLFKQLRNHPIRSLLFIGAVEYLREVIYRKFGWWTHLPVDYMDAPLADAIERPGSIPGVIATTVMFGPGGGQAPHTISDVMKTLQGDPGQWARIVNMFWGISQLFNMPQEFNAYLKDKDPKHLALMLQNAAFSTHAALKYEPHRLAKFVPEWKPFGFEIGLTKSGLVREAEALQAKVQAKTEKARETYERRHGISATLEYRTEAGQMEALRRAAGERPQKPGPPKRTKILPSRRSSGSKPRGILK